MLFKFAKNQQHLYIKSQEMIVKQSCYLYMQLRDFCIKLLGGLCYLLLDPTNTLVPSLTLLVCLKVEEDRWLIFSLRSAFASRVLYLEFICESVGINLNIGFTLFFTICSKRRREWEREERAHKKKAKLVLTMLKVFIPHRLAMNIFRLYKSGARKEDQLGLVSRACNSIKWGLWDGWRLAWFRWMVGLSWPLEWRAQR